MQIIVICCIANFCLRTCPIFLSRLFLILLPPRPKRGSFVFYRAEAKRSVTCKAMFLFVVSTIVWAIDKPLP